jgi:hypothetical protein
MSKWPLLSPLNRGLPETHRLRAPRTRAVPQTQATMTEQEAETLAARLTRVWRLTKRSFTRSPEGPFSFIGKFCDSLILFVDKKNQDPLSIQLAKDAVGVGYEWVLVSLFDEVFDCRRDEAYEHPIAENLSLFRRNCWLSGCDIEASAHEKAEWIQGFSRDELEAWNLKV